MEVKHHTPSAGGVVIKGDMVLLIYSPSRHSFAFPKGTIDKGETKQVTALREVKEETGYDVEILEFLGDYTFEFDAVDGRRYRKTVTYYLMKLANDDVPLPNLQEGEDFITIWVPIEDAFHKLTFDDSKEILHRAVVAQRTSS